MAKLFQVPKKLYVKKKVYTSYVIWKHDLEIPLLHQYGMIHFDWKTWVLQSFACLATKTVTCKAESNTVHSIVSPYSNSCESWIEF